VKLESPRLKIWTPRPNVAAIAKTKVDFPVPGKPREKRKRRKKHASQMAIQ
jgi:hypothetical protein